MRGVTWSPAGGLRCGDCGGYEIDLRSDGTALCRTCGRVSVPRSPSRSAGIARLGFALVGILLVVLAAEAAFSMMYAGGNQTVFLRTFSLFAFATGFAALVFAGVGAAPGRIGLGTQRMDRLSLAFPVQDPRMVGVMHAKSEAWTSDEPDFTGLMVLAGCGGILMVLGYLFGIA